jgi:hypothetical protein
MDLDGEDALLLFGGDGEEDTTANSFAMGLASLPLAHEEFTSSTGQAAEPHLQRCIEILNNLAEMLEQVRVFPPFAPYEGALPFSQSWAHVVL